jgi:hypothetical protein
MRAAAQRLKFIQSYLASVFGSDLHVKRVCSVVLGVMTSASIAVVLIGRAEEKRLTDAPRLRLRRGGRARLSLRWRATTTQAFLRLV